MPRRTVRKIETTSPIFDETEEALLAMKTRGERKKRSY